jgi:thiamine-monophosphate kinase
VSIAIPEGCGLTYIEEIFEGMKRLAAEFDVNILGGDTTRSMTDLVINVAVYGAVPENEILTRDAAAAGDVVFSTGFLGDSRAGLHLILDKVCADTPELKALLSAHRRPSPHLREGRFLAGRPGVRAAIDVSDGLSSDLGHIVEASRVGARLVAEKIPVSQNLTHYCDRFNRSALEFALSGGEDYTLLVTAAAAGAGAIAYDFEQHFGRPLYVIGEITASPGIELVHADGHTTAVAPTGWDHFKGH